MQWRYLAYKLRGVPEHVLRRSPLVGKSGRSAPLKRERRDLNLLGTGAATST